MPDLYKDYKNALYVLPGSKGAKVPKIGYSDLNISEQNAETVPKMFIDPIDYYSWTLRSCVNTKSPG